MSMFCFQCQEAARNEGCTIQGVCGKQESTAGLQDLLIHTMKGIAAYAHHAEALGFTDPAIWGFLVEAQNATLEPRSLEEMQGMVPSL